MRNILLFSLLSLFTCCSTLRNIETVRREVINFKDSTVINFKDSIVWTPKEYYRDYSSLLDTLSIKGSQSEMKAYVDTTNHLLAGSLSESPRIAKEWHIQYVDRVIEKTDTLYLEKINNNETVKYKRDSLFWAMLSYVILSILAIALWIYLKLR